MRASGVCTKRCSFVLLAICILALGLLGSAQAYEHHDSPVSFLEYEPGLIAEKASAKKPFFILFSAQWCFWCEEFASKTLQDKNVSNYLNNEFINVFVYADVHDDLFRRFKGTGLPFVVFLNPDGSPLFRYAGTVYAKDFLEVAKDIKAQIGTGYSLDSDDEEI